MLLKNPLLLYRKLAFKLFLQQINVFRPIELPFSNLAQI